MTYTTLAFERPAPGVVRLRLTRPGEMNTLRFELLDDLERAIDEALSARARVLVVTGEGRAFCGGAHLKYFAGPTRS